MDMAIGPIEEKKTVVEPKTGEKEPVIKVEHPQKIYEEEKRIIKSRLIIWYVWLVVEAILFFRFTLLFLAANSSSLFGTIIAVLSFPFTFLFANLFHPTVIFDSSSIIDWTIPFAMVVYAVIAWLLARAFKIRRPINPKEADEKIKQESTEVI